MAFDPDATQIDGTTRIDSERLFPALTQTGPRQNQKYMQILEGCGRLPAPVAWLATKLLRFPLRLTRLTPPHFPANLSVIRCQTNSNKPQG